MALVDGCARGGGGGCTCGARRRVAEESGEVLDGRRGAGAEARVECMLDDRERRVDVVVNVRIVTAETRESFLSGAPAREGGGVRDVER